MIQEKFLLRSLRLGSTISSEKDCWLVSGGPQRSSSKSLPSRNHSSRMILFIARPVSEKGCRTKGFCWLAFGLTWLRCLTSFPLQTQDLVILSTSSVFSDFLTSVNCSPIEIIGKELLQEHNVAILLCKLQIITYYVHNNFRWSSCPPTFSFGFKSSMFKQGWNLEGCFLCLSPHSHSKSQEYRPILFISSVIIPSRLWPQLTVEIPIKVVGQDNTRDNLIERSSLDNYKLRRDVGSFQEEYEDMWKCRH